MPLSAADKATMKALEDKYKATLTAEQNAKNDELEKFYFDPANGETLGAEVTQNFKDADADGDGMLTEAEFLTFQLKGEEQHKARGGFAPESSPEDRSTWYGIMNKFNPDTAGVSLEDIFGIWGEMAADAAQ